MTATFSAPAALGKHRDVLEQALRAAVGSGGPPILAACRYVMGWEDEHGRPDGAGGKRIRPALCLFAAEAVGGSAQDAMPGAVAVELVHNFSLVHDEIQDRDAERHHRPTIWARMGEAQAINVGDSLYTLAVRALLTGGGDPARRMAALGVLNDAIEHMIEGQWLDISFETRDAVTVGEYLAMVAGKTGALLAAPLEMGAILGGASREEATAIRRWGELVGAAFQAQDDYLGIWGDPDLTGKSNTNDLVRKKKTLPVVHGLGDTAASAAIRQAYARGELDAAGVATVVRALEAAGSDSYAREHARKQAAAADRLLDEIELPEQRRQEFRAIGRYLVERQA